MKFTTEDTENTEGGKKEGVRISAPRTPLLPFSVSSVSSVVSIRIRIAGMVLLALALLLTILRLAPHQPLSSRVPLSRAVYARSGELLRVTLADDEQIRLWTPLSAISPLAVNAALLYEDRWFRVHPGVNPLALGRAVRSIVVGGRRVGGSTITMQLARRLYEIDSRQATGKLKQIFAALWLEARYSKNDILEAYLNLVPYGGNVEGIGAASLVHFGKSPDRLSLPEALSLTLLPQNPNQRVQALRAGPRAPEFLRMREALGRRLLERWPSAGDARLLGLGVAARNNDLPFLAPHFTDQMLVESSCGSAVKTTLDLPLQRLLERQVHRFVEAQRRVGVDNAAAMLVDTRDMSVRAVVGSADFFDDDIFGQVNGTHARRSPGSVLKPFVYALGMEQGVIHPHTVLRDAPVAFSAYSPENFDGRYAGPLSATDALVRSRNIPALMVAAKLDRPTYYQFLVGAGVDLPQPETYYGLGLVLGTGEVTMEEVATLYAALANHGTLRPLHRHAGDAAAAPVRILSEEAAWLVLDMLAKNPRPASPHLPTTDARLPLPWKTGTSWGFRDAWSAGVVGPYVLVVWVGDFTGRSNPEFVGIKTAAPLFFSVVDALAAHERSLAAPISPGPRAWSRSTCAAKAACCQARIVRTGSRRGSSPGVRRPRRARSIAPSTSTRPPDAACARSARTVLSAATFSKSGPPICSSCGAAPDCRARLRRPRRRVARPSKMSPALPRASPRPSTASRTPCARARATKPSPSWPRPTATRTKSSGTWANASPARRASGRPWLWKMEPGTFVVRAVDDRGRSDAQTLRVEVSP
jgi:penicillin-binding protein 1C